MSSIFSRRVTGEIMKMKKELPMQCIGFYVDESNLHDFYFLCILDEAPFTGGEYIVHFHLSDKYPFAPPVYRIWTPNGRFSTQKTICNDFSHFHPSSYPATVSLSTLVTMFVRHMQSDDSGVGAISSSPEEKKVFASQSIEANKAIMKRLNIVEWYKDS